MYASLKWVIIGSDNGLSPVRRQDIIWTNAGILWIGPWGTNFGELLIGIPTFSFKKLRLYMSSAIWCLFCLGLNILRRMSNCGAHISFSELKGQIQEKPNINKYCGMLQYNTNSKLSHKNLTKIFLWKNCVNELLRLSLDLFSTMFRSFYLCEMYVVCYQFNAIVRGYIYRACLLTWIIHKQLMKSPSLAASLCYRPVYASWQGISSNRAMNYPTWLITSGN